MRLLTVTPRYNNNLQSSSSLRRDNLKNVLYFGIVLLIAASMFGPVFAQQNAQVQISKVIVSSARDVIMVTVTVDSKPANNHDSRDLITLQTQFQGKKGWVPVDYQSEIVRCDNHIVQIFRVHFSETGHYLFTAKVFAYPSMQLLGTASVDPPAVGRD